MGGNECYCSTSGDKIHCKFTAADGVVSINKWNPLVGEVKWNQEYLTYEPLIFSCDDYLGNSFGNVCGHRESYNYPDSYIKVVGNIYSNPELLEEAR